MISWIKKKNQVKTKHNFSKISINRNSFSNEHFTKDSNKWFFRFYIWINIINILIFTKDFEKTYNEFNLSFDNLIFNMNLLFKYLED